MRDDRTVMTRPLNRLKHQAEKRFAHKVDILVPPAGLGDRLAAMLAWCREHAARGHWDCHGHQARTPGDDGPQKFARFYFADRPIADAFSRAWL
jgi:hypothetical protein